MKTLTINKSILCSSILLALSSQTSMVCAADYGANNNNFTMLSGNGGPVGGTNLVTVTWDGTFNTDVATAVSNMTMSSASPFFNALWEAREIKVFGPGTYTFDACPGPRKVNPVNETIVAEDGSSLCDVYKKDENDEDIIPLEPGTLLTMTVGEGQVGAHMLFDWNNSVSIDVANVWNVDAPWGFSPNNGIVASLESRNTDCSVKGKGADPGSQACLDLFATQWMFTSDVVDADDISGVPGKSMVDGPFKGFKASFNIQPQVVFDDAETPVENEITSFIDLMGNDLIANVNTTGTFSIAAVDTTTVQGGSVNDNGDNTVTYTPPVDYTGPDSFTYTIRDGVDHGPAGLIVPLGIAGNYSATATVNITVGLDHVLTDDSVATNTNVAVTTADVLANDNASVSGETFTITTFDAASVNGGTVVDSGNNTFTYTPPLDFNGADSFTYTIDDGSGVSGIGTVNISVEILTIDEDDSESESESDDTASGDTASSSSGSSSLGLLTLSLALLMLPFRIFSTKK